MTGCTWPYGGTVHACPFDADFIVHRVAQGAVPALSAPMCTYHARLSRDFLIASYGPDGARFSDVTEATATT